ncbi:MAG TPA: alpha/beta fold hydrolase [Solirubrobacteraceae bacterium]|nr:alpha/beta fold hydrolase [Solirubrobacteraceae bacterium]
MTRHEPTGPVVASRRGAFWITGERVAGPLGTVFRGPMWVEWESPAEPSPGPPWVLVHGGGGQGTDYLTTPDGRPGWARLLVEQGHTVYVVDRPGHGRSPHHPDVLGPLGPQLGAPVLRAIFFPPAEGPDSHPTAHLHSQWPGGREPGDPVFDQFQAPVAWMPSAWAEMEAVEQAGLGELLDRVGPAVLVTHSAGGPGTFLAADARPDQVAALIAIETIGPPFAKRPEMGLDLAWGITSNPLTFDPPATDPSELNDGESRRLANLSRFPIAVVTAEASMFALFDHELMAFLERGGCDVELVRLADHGVHGNSHGIMMELNNADTLGVITRWVAGRLPG